VKSLLNSVIKFYNPLKNEELSGYVIQENDQMVIVKIEHGVYHGELCEVWREDIIDDSYDEEVEERLYSWYTGDE
jgi:hypothetical protein